MSEPHKTDALDRLRRRPSIFRELPSPPGKVALGIAGCALLASAVWLVYAWLPVRGDVRVDLVGSGVEHLAAEAPVALGTQRIGCVDDVDIRDGRLTARLRLERRYASRLPASSRFRVESLNAWMPGNVGVRIYTPDTAVRDELLADGAVIETDNLILPPEVPWRFYVLVGLAIVVAVVVLVVALLLRDLLKSVFVIVAGCSVLLAAYVYFHGRISPP